MLFKRQHLCPACFHFMRKMMMISDDDKAERRLVADAGMDVGWVDPWVGLDWVRMAVHGHFHCTGKG